MTRLARTERTELCDVALQLGADQPTLCEGWTVRDLLAHLALRERSPAAVGIVLRPVSGLTERATRRRARTDFAVLVERVRTGPPRWSPFALRVVDAAVNTLEYLVHHEDIRRAQPSWSPRTLGDETEQTIWSALRLPAKAATRSLPVGLTLENSATGSTLVAREGAQQVVVRGLPSELALYVFGRRAHARVEASGDADAVARLADASLGL